MVLEVSSPFGGLGLGQLPRDAEMCGNVGFALCPLTEALRGPILPNPCMFGITMFSKTPGTRIGPEIGPFWPFIFNFLALRSHSIVPYGARAGCWTPPQVVRIKLIDFGLLCRNYASINPIGGLYR